MDTHRGRRRLLALAIGSLLVAPWPLAHAATVAVDEVGLSFSPSQVDIVANDRVLWTNRSSGTHTVSFENGADLHPDCNPSALLRVGCQGPGTTVQRTFTAAGTYPYFCKFHRGEGMTGVVVVASAATTTATVPASTTTTTRGSTTTTARATSSTTPTTRVLSTSSTVVKSTTTTSDTTNVLLPGAPPPFPGDDPNSSATGESGGSSDDGSDSTTVAVIVGLLLAVSAGGGFLLWRLRPGRA